MKNEEMTKMDKLVSVMKNFQIPLVKITMSNNTNIIVVVEDFCRYEREKKPSFYDVEDYSNVETSSLKVEPSSEFIALDNFIIIKNSISKMEQHTNIDGWNHFYTFEISRKNIIINIDEIVKIEEYEIPLDYKEFFVFDEKSISICKKI